MLNLKPELLWKYFEAVAAIPRGSGNEKAAGDYVIAVAKAHGLQADRDAAGNVVVRKPATPGREGVAPVLLQGHLDMVCEKNADVKHDFLKDPIRLRVDGPYVKAMGTSLGADNGIAVAACLALIEDPEAQHGPLEMLFTVEEETGLIGASKLRPGFVKAKRMINLDTEEEGAVYVGCAGGKDTLLTLKARREAAKSRVPAWRIVVKGLRGGHSGVDIHEQRGNAVRILARLLASLRAAPGVKIVSFDGGSKRNAIAREAAAVVHCRDEKNLKAAVRKFEKAVRADLGKVDPGLAIVVEKARPELPPFEDKFAAKLLAFCNALPHGVLKMSQDIPGLVETSTNFAIVATTAKTVEVATSQRSSSADQIDWAAEMIASVGVLAGATVKASSSYPGWKPDLESPILKAVIAKHREYFKDSPVVKADPQIKAIHAGLECGIIGERYPGMDMVSIGPLLENVHSPDERVHIESVERFYGFLKAVLRDLA
jgi:dipeptidase D